MGCADGIRRRKYHGLLLVASPSDERRWMLVNGIEAWLETDRGTIPLTSQQYAPDVVHPELSERVEFGRDPRPWWSHRIGRGAHLLFTIGKGRRHVETHLTWNLIGDGNKPPEIGSPARLRVRLLMSGRDWHALHQRNPHFQFTPRVNDSTFEWRPYGGVPPVVVRTDGMYEHTPEWYRQFLYIEDRDRGLDCTEDLASPGVFTWELGGDRWGAQLLLTTSTEFFGHSSSDLPPSVPDENPADVYFVRRSDRHTIIAGYPWFTDWGRDTFVALPGLCMERGKLPLAESILISWSETLSDGMLPNLFPSGSTQPAFNSVDASLWFIIAVRELVDEAARRGYEVNSRKRLSESCEAIVQAYANGARYGIHLDSDGLLAAGQPGVALTWMDAVVDSTPVTPRIGKPVEVQALWINALTFAASWNEKWYAVAERAKLSFAIRFRNPETGSLYDVVDVDHVAGSVDARMRPNQIFAVGGLPVAVIEGKRALAIVEAVERDLLTPYGLRSLAPSDPAYVGRADGSMPERDRAYHQGTVWPWLLHAFLDAKARVKPRQSPESRIAATRKFLGPLKAHVSAAGMGHVSEIFDGDAPHEPRGCPFQAWSLAALLRAYR